MFPRNRLIISSENVPPIKGPLASAASTVKVGPRNSNGPLSPPRAPDPEKEHLNAKNILPFTKNNNSGSKVIDNSGHTPKSSRSVLFTTSSSPIFLISKSTIASPSTFRQYDVAPSIESAIYFESTVKGRPLSQSLNMSSLLRQSLAPTPSCHLIAGLL